MWGDSLKFFERIAYTNQDPRNCTTTQHADDRNCQRYSGVIRYLISKRRTVLDWLPEWLDRHGKLHADNRYGYSRPKHANKDRLKLKWSFVTITLVRKEADNNHV